MGLNLGDAVEPGRFLAVTVMGGEFSPAEAVERTRAQRAKLIADGASQEALDQADFGSGISWGWSATRNSIAARDKALALCVADLFLHCPGAFDDHVRFALYAGVSPAEFREIMFQLIPYAGLLHVSEAARVYEPICDEWEMGASGSTA